MDDKDRRILAILRANARMPAAAIARQVGLARSSVQERIARLERQGIINGYTIVTDKAGGGKNVRAHAMLSVDPKRAATIVSALENMPEITECLTVSGDFDLIAIIETDTLEQMDRVLDRIGALGGVRRTTSTLILSTRFRRPPVSG